MKVTIEIDGMSYTVEREIQPTYLMASVNNFDEMRRKLLNEASAAAETAAHKLFNIAAYNCRVVEYDVNGHREIEAVEDVNNLSPIALEVLERRLKLAHNKRVTATREALK